jgi:cell wall-associated NlpC family hydrolase
LRSKLELRRVAAGAVALAAFAVAAAPVGASTGGTSTETESTGPPGKAKLRDGEAIPPSDAPDRVVNAIEAANEIAKGKDYCMGGGHARWKSRCYDCSGAVSYALKGARMLDSPLPSGSLAKWGKKGKGDWITVYAHGGHAYAVIAGLRWDTSMTAGEGPGWSNEKRSSSGFKKRHFKDGY